MSTLSAARRQSLITLLRTVPYLRPLDEAVLGALADVSSPSSFEAGEVIFLEGEPVAGLYIVEEGIVKISRFSSEGREHIFHLATSGHTFNDVAALDGGPNPATTTACGAVNVWRITRTDLRHVVDRHPTLAWSLIESIARRSRHLVGLVQDLSMRNVKGRLAHLLLQEARSNSNAEVTQLLTQEEMASRLGTVREMVGRSLRSLAAAGIIEFDRHRIVILDEERLAEEAEV
ncbi:MAG: Crp/Fnr family transcriptional regulator [Caldilineaceae bacterium]|nr:Crp/Fnr family transcriptional regulator [Caldilineaceae bacterium]